MVKTIKPYAFALLAVMAGFVSFPIFVLAQTAVAGAPPTDLKTSLLGALWTAVVLPLLGMIGTYVVQWIKAKAEASKANASTSTRSTVEGMLLQLADGVGAPIAMVLAPKILAAVDPNGPGGIKVTQAEWDDFEASVEEELKKLLTPANLDLVMKTIGLPAAVRLLATFLLKRTFVAQATHADAAVPSDPSVVIYGRTPEQVAAEPASDAG